MGGFGGRPVRLLFLLRGDFMACGLEQAALGHEAVHAIREAGNDLAGHAAPAALQPHTAWEWRGEGEWQRGGWLGKWRASGKGSGKEEDGSFVGCTMGSDWGWVHAAGDWQN